MLEAFFQMIEIIDIAAFGPEKTHGSVRQPSWLPLDNLDGGSHVRSCTYVLVICLVRVEILSHMEVGFKPLPDYMVTVEGSS